MWRGKDREGLAGLTAEDFLFIYPEQGEHALQCVLFDYRVGIRDQVYVFGFLFILKLAWETCILPSRDEELLVLRYPGIRMEQYKGPVKVQSSWNEAYRLRK